VTHRAVRFSSGGSASPRSGKNCIGDVLRVPADAVDHHRRRGIEEDQSNANQNTRNALLAALPFPETKIALDTLPLPTEPIVSAAGVVDAVRGRYRGLATRKRTENHVVLKGDLSVFNGANLATTYTRMRPWTLEPRFNVNGSNDRVFPNEQDRVATQFVMAHGQWVS